jgi:hypothetical protein
MTTPATNPLSTAANAFSSPTVGKLAGQEQTLASWAAPYITDMLGKTKALTSQPYQTYQGPLTAGVSDLQKKAFEGLGGLTTPGAIGQAATTAGDIAGKAMGMGYTPTQFSSTFQTPGAYQPGQFANTFQTPGAYTPTTGSFTEQGIAGQYMNPYLQQALQPQLQELNRQAQIQQMQNAARMSKAGAFGGGRQAIMDAELQRNLLQQAGRTTGEAYSTAFDKAMSQFNTEQQRKMQEAQFGAQQGMTAAELSARYGSEAQRAAEQSRQFGAQQGMTAAELGARYGLEAQRAAEQSRQFGAGYGLDALSRALSAAQVQGQMGQAMGAEQRANLAAQLGGGAAQREIEAQGIAADMAEFERQRQHPYQQLQFQQAMLQNMPITAMNMTYQEPSPFSELLTGTGGLMGLYERLFGKG